MMMVGVGTYFAVYDNSGAIEVLCIRVKRLPRDLSSGVRVGDVITCVVKRSVLIKTVKRRRFARQSEIYNGVVVQVSSGVRRVFGVSLFSFFQNVVILMRRDDPYLPLATRIYISVPKELRFYKYYRLMSLAVDVF